MTSQDQAKKFAAKVARLVDAATQVEQPPADLSYWYEGMLDYHRDKLVLWGLLDPRKISRDGTLETLIDEWRDHLMAKGNTPRYVRQTRKRVAELLDATGAVRWRDVTLGAVSATLDIWAQQGRITGRKGREKETVRLSPQSRKHYVTVLRQFATWMADFKNAHNPLITLSPPADAKIRQHPKRARRALSMDDIAKLIRVTRSQPTRWNMTGPERAMCYDVALNTGYRAGELAAITPELCRLQAITPVLCVPACASKRRQDEAQPIPTALAERLAEYVRSIPDGLALFPLSDKTARMIYEDLDAAKIPRETPAGWADFHALRHSAITELVRKGTPPAILKEWARHSDIRTTMQYYTHLGLADRAGALDALPDLGATPEREDPAGRTLAFDTYLTQYEHN